MIKWILSILAGLIVIIIIAAISIVTFVNPNQFKPAIKAAVLKHTGQTLTIQGPITWRWFPMLALELNNVVLDNPLPFSGALFSAKYIQAECALLPLLKGKIFLDLTLKHMNLTLTRNQQGLTNWGVLQQQLAAPKKSLSPSKETTVHSASSRILLSGLTITNSQVNFNDEQTNKQYKLTGLNFSADNLFSGSPGVGNPIALSFALQNPGNPALGPIGTFVGKGTLQFQAQKLKIDSFTIHSKEYGTLAGSVAIDRFTPPFNIQGAISSKALQFGKMKLEAFQAHILAKNNLISLNPIDFQIAGGQQNAMLQIDLQDHNPKYSLTQKGQQFEIAPILELFNANNKLTGQTRLSLHLTTMGNNPDQWRRHLSGQLNLEMFNGKLQGYNLIALVKNAQNSITALINALLEKSSGNIMGVINDELKRWKPSQSGENFTPFDTAKATATIHNGILKNSDLLITDPAYRIQGAGILNLINNTIQYQASFLLNDTLSTPNDKIANYLRTTPLYITVQGNISDPVIRPDMSAYVNGSVQAAGAQAVEKLLHKTVDKALGNFLGPLSSP